MYLYHADALAIGGTLVRPIPQVIESRAACSLPTAGGTSSCRVEKFSLNGLISFDMAQCDLAGGVEIKNGVPLCVTRVSVVIEGLNILNMVMADRIVARLASEHGPNDKEPKIITTGCHYDGLRIAGHPVEVETAHNLYSDMPTFADWQKAWTSKNKATRKRVQDCMIGSTLPSAPAKTDPQHLQDVHRAVREQGKARDLRQTVLSSFVSKVTGIAGSEIDNWGPIIVVPQFGTIYLGEVIVSPSQRRVNMMRLELGSPDGGSFNLGSGSSNGTTIPPT